MKLLGRGRVPEQVRARLHVVIDERAPKRVNVATDLGDDVQEWVELHNVMVRELKRGDYINVLPGWREVIEVRMPNPSRSDVRLLLRGLGYFDIAWGTTYTVRRPFNRKVSSA